MEVEANDPLSGASLVDYPQLGATFMKVLLQVLTCLQLIKSELT